MLGFGHDEYASDGVAQALKRGELGREHEPAVDARAEAAPQTQCRDEWKQSLYGRPGWRHDVYIVEQWSGGGDPAHEPLRSDVCFRDCSYEGMNDLYANADALELSVGNFAGNVIAGAYDIVVPGTGSSSDGGTSIRATAEFSGALSARTPDFDLWATGGTISLTAVSASNVTGEYNVTFETQGTFTGTFNVAICDLPDGPVGQPGTLNCIP